MFVISVKARNVKLILSLFVAVAIVLGVAMTVPMANQSKNKAGEIAVGKSIEKINFKNVSSNEERISFLKQFGWEVESEAIDIKEITIPYEFDQVYQNYNRLQLPEGMDLEKYKGKSVKRYTYLVNNYDYDGSVYVNLMIYRNTVIGGDVCSAKKDGFVHGLTKGSDFLA